MESSVSLTTPPPPRDGILTQISLPMFQSKGWLRFLGVMSVLEGVLDALSIVGLLVCWLPIWMGILLFQAAGDAERGHHHGDGELLASANRRLKTYFMLRGITILLEIMLVILALSIFGTLGILGALG